MDEKNKEFDQAKMFDALDFTGCTHFVPILCSFLEQKISFQKILLLTENTVFLAACQLQLLISGSNDLHLIFKL